MMFPYDHSDPRYCVYCGQAIERGRLDNNSKLIVYDCQHIRCKIQYAIDITSSPGPIKEYELINITLYWTHKNKDFLLSCNPTLGEEGEANLYVLQRGWEKVLKIPNTQLQVPEEQIINRLESLLGFL